MWLFYFKLFKVYSVSLYIHFYKTLLESNIEHQRFIMVDIESFPGLVNLVLQVMRTFRSTYMCKTKIDRCYLLEFSHPEL